MVLLGSKLRFQKKNSAIEYFKLYSFYEKKYGRIALLYQLGDFYNLFGVKNDDENFGNIHEVCNDLGFRVTRSNKKILTNSVNNPLQGGFPRPKLDHYVKRCVDLGYTVVVYSQRNSTKDPKRKERFLDKIVSAGTYIDDVAHADPVNMVCIYIDSEEQNIDASIIVLDLSTGACTAYSVIDEKNHVPKIVARIVHSSKPKEIILVKCSKEFELSLDINETSSRAIHRMENVDKNYRNSTFQDEFLRKIFPHVGEHISPVEYLNMEMNSSLVIALMISINFAHEHRDGIATMISKPRIIRHRSELYVSHLTMRYFNVTEVENKTTEKSLFSVINFTKTPMGRRHLLNRLVSPIVDPSTLEKRYREIEQCISLDLPNGKETSELLSSLGDIERMHRKIYLKRLQPAEFAQLDSAYQGVWSIIRSFRSVRINDRTKKLFRSYVLSYRKRLDLKRSAKYNLDNADAPLFKAGVYPDLDELYEKYSRAWSDLKAYALEMSRLIGEKDDLVDIVYTKSEGYVFKTTATRFKLLVAKKPGIEHKSMSSAVKIFDSRVRELSHLIIQGKDDIIRLNATHFLELEDEISQKFKNVADVIVNYICRVDCLLSIATCSSLYNFCRPKIDASKGRTFICATNLRHPIVERIDSGKDYVPNDVDIGSISYMVYGINGSGKSLYLKQIGLAIIMAQAGMFVAADSLDFYPCKNLITKLSKRDDMYNSRSEFGCEMSDMRDMFDKAGKNTIILADELCSGTTTVDAIALVTGAIHQLIEKETTFIFTSHLHQLKEIPLIQELMDENKFNMFHIDASASDGRITHGRKLLPGSGPDNYGIEIAKALKIGNDDFIRDAINTRRFLKGESSNVLDAKYSRYNPKVLMKECSVCGSKTDLITHHEEHQADADENGMINGRHKNRIANLKVLCQRCHMKEHANDREIEFEE